LQFLLVFEINVLCLKALLSAPSKSHLVLNS
jgi:hypothetical protein